MKFRGKKILACSENYMNYLKVLGFWSVLSPTYFPMCLMVRIFRLDASLIYINSTNIPPIMIINRIYEHQNLLSL